MQTTLIIIIEIQKINLLRKKKIMTVKKNRKLTFKPVIPKRTKTKIYLFNIIIGDKYN